MLESGARMRKIIPEETMLIRLAQSEQMREFFIQMWMQNPGLAKQGGIRVRDLMTSLEGDASQKISQQPSIVASSKQRGISLIELIMFIVIVGVALAGILGVMNITTRDSAGPMIRKQSLAIAESLLEEVELMPFTYCDPDDPTAATATSPSLVSGGCTAQVENMGLEAAYAYQATAETRYSNSTPFDNVNDYDGFTMPAGALKDITGSPVGPAGYAVAVAVTKVGMPAAGASLAIALDEALLVKVTVTGPDNLPIVLEGIRTRYAPNGVP